MGSAVEDRQPWWIRGGFDLETKFAIFLDEVFIKGPGRAAEFKRLIIRRQREKMAKRRPTGFEPIRRKTLNRALRAAHKRADNGDTERSYGGGGQSSRTSWRSGTSSAPSSSRAGSFSLGFRRHLSYSSQQLSSARSGSDVASQGAISRRAGWQRSGRVTGSFRASKGSFRKFGLGSGRRRATASAVNADEEPQEEDAPAGFVGMSGQVDGSTDRPEHNGAIAKILSMEAGTGKVLLEVVLPALGRPSTDVGSRLYVKATRLRVRTADGSFLGRGRVQRAHEAVLEAKDEEASVAAQQLLADSLRLLVHRTPFAGSLRRQMRERGHGALMGNVNGLDEDEPAPRADATKGAPPKRLPWDKINRPNILLEERQIYKERARLWQLDTDSFRRDQVAV